MTKLTKKLSRESNSYIRDRGGFRPIILTIEPSGLLTFRAKGCRRSYSLTIQKCYELAVLAEIEAAKKAKKAAKKAEKK